MSLNPVILLGVVLGLLGAIVKYMRSKSIKDSAVAFVLLFLAFGTPLHFVIAGVYLGSKVNRRVYLSWSNNWGTFLVSLLGLPVLFGVWQAALRLLIVVVATGVDDPAGGVVLGVGMALVFVILILVGLACYALSSFYASFMRGRNFPNGENGQLV
jgi:hypothetical protein